MTPMNLAASILELRPLAEALPEPFRVVAPAGWWAAKDGHLAPAEVLESIGTRLRVPIRVERDLAVERTALRVFDQVAADRLALHRRAGADLEIEPGALPALLADVDAVERAGFDRHRSIVPAPGGGGGLLRTYAVGERDRPAVVLASAVGVPAVTCATWMETLAREFFVVTWESRGIFGDVADFASLDVSTEAQADDLLAVMDHYEIPPAHVMGFCGGSVVALAAAAKAPGRVRSLSLWHGAYELGPDMPKADHHRNIQALMAMAAQSPETAQVVHNVVLDAMCGSVPPDLAHLVLYPFASADLFYRYCRVNGAVTDVDVRPYLPRVDQNTLVVTSRDDGTAAPEGSRQVAKGLPRARLVVEPHGDHLSLFAMGGRLAEIAREAIVSDVAAVLSNDTQET